jgi:hypothetical protein
MAGTSAWTGSVCGAVGVGAKDTPLRLVPQGVVIDQIRPGDTLLYSGTGFVDFAIRAKTWSRFSHCELYEGQGRSLASRNGLGVARYPVRTNGLLAVYRLRASVPFDLTAVQAWFETVNGQGYDWWGLLSFTSAKVQGKENYRMFCSEMLVRAYRIGIGAMVNHPGGKTGDRRVLQVLGLDPFGGENADAVAPAQFARSPLFIEVTN